MAGVVIVDNPGESKRCVSGAFDKIRQQLVELCSNSGNITKKVKHGAELIERLEYIKVVLRFTVQK